MYTTCLFCDRAFGTNDTLRTLPVGRRIAVDAAKGRLWVVCRGCGRWNLVPLDERWEAIEEAERAYRDTRLRTATDNIGLARLAEGLELVRIGAPLRPEFAAWRYGDQFGQRRRRAILYGVGGAVAVGAVGIGGLAAGVITAGAINVITIPINLYQAWNLRQKVVRLTLQDGDQIHVRTQDFRSIRFVGNPDALTVEAPVRTAHPTFGGISSTTRTERLTGVDAHGLVGLLVPKVNHNGASRARIDDAVRLLEDVGGPTAFLRELHINPRRWRAGQLLGDDGALWHMPKPVQLALEMALHEDAERAALEGELSMLSVAWKEAEQIAAIADRLTLPAGIDERLDDLRSRP